MAKEKANSILPGLPSEGDQNKGDGFKNKWIYLSAFLFLALGAAIYRLYSYEECPQIDFELSTIPNSEGAMFKFYDFTPGADTWEWDFGDNAGISRERSPIHLYKKAGTYDVMLTINGTCSRFQTLTIIQGTPGFQEETAMDPNLITSADSSNTSQPDAMEEPGSDSDPSAQVATRLVRAPDPASTANQQVAATATNTRENVTRNPTSANQENNIKSQIPTRQESLVSQESTLTHKGTVHRKVSTNK